MLNPVVFQELDDMWGPHTIDRFPDVHNRQLERFNSQYWNPWSEAVDAFTCDWSKENNWWCLPLYLISRLLRHAEATKARGTLVIPHWPSAPFWPILFPVGSHPQKWVQQMAEPPNSQELFLPGMSGGNIFKGVKKVAVLALRISFA